LLQTRCSICGVQQHSICQGYLEGHNSQPPQHVCHLCLLGRMVDRATLARLCELALERRTMDLLLSKEVDSAVDLSRKLGIYRRLQPYRVDTDCVNRHAVRQSRKTGHVAGFARICCGAGWTLHAKLTRHDNLPGRGQHTRVYWFSCKAL
jgi:hypothetical protein